MYQTIVVHLKKTFDFCSNQVCLPLGRHVSTFFAQLFWVIPCMCLVIPSMFWVIPSMFWIIPDMFWVIPSMLLVITLMFWVITLMFWGTSLMYGILVFCI